MTGGRDQPAGLPVVDGGRDGHPVLSQLVVQPAAGELGGRLLAVVCAVVVEQGSYLAECLVGSSYLLDSAWATVKVKSRPGGSGVPAMSPEPRPGSRPLLTTLMVLTG